MNELQGMLITAGIVFLLAFIYPFTPNSSTNYKLSELGNRQCVTVVFVQLLECLLCIGLWLMFWFGLVILILDDVFYYNIPAVVGLVLIMILIGMYLRPLEKKMEADIERMKRELDKG